MKHGKLLPVIIMILSGFSSCSKAPIIVPEFNTPTEQYIFAKNLKDAIVFEGLTKKEMKDHNKALVLAYRSVIDHFPDDLRVTPLAWVDLADTYFRLGDYHKAVELYETSINKYPDQEDIYCKALFGGARSHDRIKNYETALSLYKECFERFENDKRPHLSVLGQQARINYSKIRIR